MSKEIEAKSQRVIGLTIVEALKVQLSAAQWIKYMTFNQFQHPYNWISPLHWKDVIHFL